MEVDATEEQSAGVDAALVQEFEGKWKEVWQQLHRVVVGQDKVIAELLTALFAQGHALIIGVPGLAKTLLIKTLADALGWDFKRIQFTPDLMPSDITGTEILQTDTQTGERSMRFIKGPIFANIILADEINRTSPKTQAALLEAMQEYTVTAAGHSYELERPFFVVATQNPIEQEGTYPLPEAQLDRFMFCINIDYPSELEERKIVDETTTKELPRVDKVLTRDDILRHQQLVRSIPVSQHVRDYAVNLARTSRPTAKDAPKYITDYVEWGAGPRASQYLVLGAKSLALFRGKPAPSCDEVRSVAYCVLQHRIIPNYNATGEGISAAKIVSWLLKNVKQPDYKH